MGLVLFDEDVNMEFMKISGSITQGLRGIGSSINSHPICRKEAWWGIFLACHLEFSGSRALADTWAVLALVASVGEYDLRRMDAVRIFHSMSLPMLSIAYYGKKVTKKYKWFSKNGELL